VERGNDECYKCGGRGHFAVVCPTREMRSSLLCEDEPIEMDDSQETDVEQQEDATSPEEILEGSNLPLCVIRRILAGQQAEEDEDHDWIRTNIFHTRVEHNGKSLNLIIDNGSGMNVISQEAVQKLKLPTEKHPKPYKVSWVDDTSIPYQTPMFGVLFIRKELQRVCLV
jgi:hypothetical protein